MLHFLYVPVNKAAYATIVQFCIDSVALLRTRESEVRG